MKREIKTTLALDGEKAFKEGLSAASRQLGVLKSEMKANKAVFGENQNSLEALTAKGKLFEQQVDQQKEVVRALAQAVEESADKYGEADKRTDDYRIKLNNATAALAEMERELTSNSRAIDEMGQETEQTVSKMDQLEAAARKVGESLHTAGEKMTSIGKEMTKKLTVPIMGVATAVGGMVASFGWKRLVAMDAATAQLKGLGYAMEDVERISGQVKKSVQGTTMTMAEGTSVAAGALAAGVKEGAELENYIKQVGNAAVGANRPIADMAQIFNRIQGSGKLMTKELNMIEQGMPGFAQAMSDSLGVTQEEFRKMVTAGKISSGQFLEVMDGFAGEMSEAYANSWEGMVSNTKAWIGIIGETMLGGVFEESKDAVADFIELLKSDEMMAGAEKAGKAIGEAFTSIIGAVRGAVEWFTNLSPTMQKTIVVAVGIAAAIGPLLVALGTLATALSGLGAVFTAVGAVGGVLATAIGAISLPVVAVVAVIGGLIAIGVALYKNWDTISAKASELWASVKNTFGKIAVTISETWEGVKKKFSEGVQNIKTGWNNFWSNLAADAASIGKNLIEGIGRGITNLAGWFKNLVTSFATNNILKPLKAILRIQSPSKVTEEIGQMITLGLAAGMENAAWALDEKAQKLMKKTTDTMLSELEKYNSQVEKAMDQLAADEEKLTAEYEGQLERRSNALYGWVGLFDEIPEAVAASGKEMMKNLEEQVDYFAAWQAAMEELGERVLVEGLIDELAQMGPKALPQIEALNSMSGKELDKYVKLWQEKHDLARGKATGELDGLKIETEEKIDELHKKTQKQLETYAKDFVGKMRDIRIDTDTELKKLPVSAQTQGRAMMDGLINSIYEKLPALQAAVAQVQEAMAIQAAAMSDMAMVVPAMASGGIVTRPTLALIGEAGPEAVVPLDGRTSFGFGVQEVRHTGTIRVEGVTDKGQLLAVKDIVIEELLREIRS